MKTPQAKRKAESYIKGEGNLIRGAKIPKAEDPPSVKTEERKVGRNWEFNNKTKVQNKKKVIS